MEMDTDSPDSHIASEPQLRFGKIDGLATRVGAATAAARKLLFSEQHEEGYWCGELEADTTLESDYILLHTLLGTGDQQRFQKRANPPVRERVDAAVKSSHAGQRQQRQADFRRPDRIFLEQQEVQEKGYEQRKRGERRLPTRNEIG